LHKLAVRIGLNYPSVFPCDLRKEINHAADIAETANFGNKKMMNLLTVFCEYFFVFFVVPPRLKTAISARKWTFTVVFCQPTVPPVSLSSSGSAVFLL